MADWANTKPTAVLDGLLREANVPAAAVREPWSGRDDRISRFVRCSSRWGMPR